MEIDYAQIGTIGILGLFAIREFFMYLKSRSNENGLNKEDYKQDVAIAELKTKVEMILTNHLPHIEKAMKEFKEENSQWHKIEAENRIRMESKLDDLLKK